MLVFAMLRRYIAAALGKDKTMNFPHGKVPVFYPCRPSNSLLGRMPSAVGYQPTLAEEMGRLQERITSTRSWWK